MKNLTNTLMLSIVCLLIFSTLISGTMNWLKNVGLVDSQNYTHIRTEQAELKYHIDQYFADPSTYSKQQVAEYVERNKANQTNIRKYLYQLPQELIPLAMFTKLSKYIFYGLFSLLIVCQFLRSPVSIRQCAYFKEAIMLFTLCLLSTIINLNTMNLITLTSGLYVFSFLIFALLISSNHSHDYINLIAKTLVWIILITAVMCVIEYFRGIQHFTSGQFFNKRVTAFMGQPSSLGLFIAISFAFVMTSQYFLHKSKWGLSVLGIVSTLIIIASGSNLALVCLTLFLILFTTFNVKESNQKFLYISAIAVLFIILLFIIDRNVVNSLTGRLEKFIYYFLQQQDLLSRLLGQGLGHGSNTLLQAQSLFVDKSAPLIITFSTDSTPLLILIQTGIIGCIMFYFFFFKALYLATRMRPLIVMFLIASLGTNIIEIFPLNLMLGFILATENTSVREQHV